MDELESKAIVRSMSSFIPDDQWAKMSPAERNAALQARRGGGGGRPQGGYDRREGGDGFIPAEQWRNMSPEEQRAAVQARRGRGQ